VVGVSVNGNASAIISAMTESPSKVNSVVSWIRGAGWREGREEGREGGEGGREGGRRDSHLHPSASPPLAPAQLIQGTASRRNQRLTPKPGSPSYPHPPTHPLPPYFLPSLPPSLAPPHTYLRRDRQTWRYWLAHWHVHLCVCVW